MREWKNYLKGVYDTKPELLKILVTGSARLETFRQSGDSLAGRFFRHRLLPISIVELENPDEASLDRLIKRGGFPEPFLAESDTDADRWRMQYSDGLVRTDVLDFENVHDLRAMQTLLEILRRRVGSPVSYASIAGDIDISPNTVKRYIGILESLYIVFLVTPYSKNIGRSLLKEPKIYFFDTGLVAGDEGARFENHIAVSLLKYVYAIEDYKGTYAELKYMRTKEKKEVDFFITISDSIDSIVEVKMSDREISKTLAYFCDKYGLKGFQVVKNLRNEYKERSITVVKGLEYQKNLWPKP
jgi:predicted AAA+ superfamily ATPase